MIHRLRAPGRLVPTVLAVFCLCALVAVLAGLVLPSAAAIVPVLDRQAAVSAAARSRLGRAFLFTLFQAGMSALTACVLGLPAAFLAARRNFPGRRFLLALSGVPLCVPPAIIALAFVLFYGRQGYLNVFLMRVFSLSEPPVTFLYSTAGLIIAHGLYNFPVVLRTVSRVWELLPANREEAAVLLGAGRLRLFRTIILPQIAPPVVSSFLLVFLYCFFSFVIVLLFGGIGGTTLEVELYQAARNVLNFRFAAMIAIVETLAAGTIVFLYVSAERKLGRAAGAIGPVRSRSAFSGPGEGLFAGIYLALIAVFFVGPLLSVPLRSVLVTGSARDTVVSLEAWRSFTVSRAFMPALINTLLVGAGTAFLACGAALAYGLFPFVGKYRAVRPGPAFLPKVFGAASAALPFTPLAVSSIMLGFGWTILVPRGSSLVLIVAQASLAWPFAWVQLSGALSRIPKPVLEASLLLSSSPLDAAFRVYLPLVKRGVLTSFAFVFAISAGDATLPLVLSLPRFENLALLVFRLAGSYRFAEACVCATVIALLCGAVFFVQDSEGGMVYD